MSHRLQESQHLEFSNTSDMMCSMLLTDSAMCMPLVLRLADTGGLIQDSPNSSSKGGQHQDHRRAEHAKAVAARD